MQITRAVNTRGHNTDVQFRLPLHGDVPQSAYEAAEEIANDQARREAEETSARVRRVEELARTVRRQVVDLVGADTHMAFRQMLRAERLRTREMFLPPAGLKVDFDQVHQARKERANAFLRERGIDPERLAAIVGDARADLADDLGSPLRGRAEDAYAIASTMAGSLASASHATADVRAFAMHPPFDGWQKGFHFANLVGSGFSASHFNGVGELEGTIQQQVHIENTDASDFDFAEAVADAQVALWFRPSMRGRVRLTIEAQCRRSTHSLRTVDEWGWSDSSTNQTNSLMMHVLHANVAGPSFALTSNFHWRTDVTQDVFRSFIPIGTTVFATLTSNGGIPAGEWVLIRAGSRSTTTSFTNDVEIHSTPDFQWLIRTVAIQMIP